MENVFKNKWILNYFQIVKIVRHIYSKLIHRIVYDHKPKALTNYISQSMINVDSTRMVRQCSTKRLSKTDKTSKSLMYRGLKIYNMLPNAIKSTPPKKFNKNIKGIIRAQFSPDRIP